MKKGTNSEVSSVEIMLNIWHFIIVETCDPALASGHKPTTIPSGQSQSIPPDILH